MIPPARASALTARSSASTRAVRTRSLASPAESRQVWRSQAAVDTAPVTPAAPRRSKTTSRRANSDSSRETATRSPTRSAARASSGRPATSSASSRSSIGSRQPALPAPPPPAPPSAPLPAPEHMFDSVVDPIRRNGDFPHEPAGLVPMTAPEPGPPSSLAKVARDNLARAGLAGMVEVRVEPRWETLPQLRPRPRPFDIIFIDADRPAYLEYLSWSLRLSRPGSLIIADNVVRNGAVIDVGSHDAGVQGMRRFHELLAAEPRLSATVVQTVGVKGAQRHRRRSDTERCGMTCFHCVTGCPANSVRCRLAVRVEVAHDPGGVTYGDDVRGQVPGDHRASAHHAVAPDRDSGQHDHTAAKPDIVADADRLGRLSLGAPEAPLDGMGGREHP